MALDKSLNKIIQFIQGLGVGGGGMDYMVLYSIAIGEPFWILCNLYLEKTWGLFHLVSPLLCLFRTI